MKLEDKLRLRAKHTCVKDMSSLRCAACNAGVPYPHLTTEEIITTMTRSKP